MIRKTGTKILVSVMIGVSVLLPSQGCKKNPTSPEPVRIGAICNDGTRSSATGSGACSHHGGVREWLYK